MEEAPGQLAAASTAFCLLPRPGPGVEYLFSSGYYHSTCSRAPSQLSGSRRRGALRSRYFFLYCNVTMCWSTCGRET